MAGTNDTKKDSKPREPTVKDKVQLRLADGQFAAAAIDKVNKDGTVDLTAVVAGKDVVITSSPRDDDGKAADSWRFPVEA